MIVLGCLVDNFFRVGLIWGGFRFLVLLVG